MPQWQTVKVEVIRYKIEKESIAEARSAIFDPVSVSFYLYLLLKLK